MKTDNNKINQAIENLPDAFAYHQAVLDDHGNPRYRRAADGY